MNRIRVETDENTYCLIADASGKPARRGVFGTVAEYGQPAALFDGDEIYYCLITTEESEDLKEAPKIYRLKMGEPVDSDWVEVTGNHWPLPPDENAEDGEEDEDDDDDGGDDPDPDDGEPVMPAKLERIA